MAEREALSKRCQLSTEVEGESCCEGWQSVETPRYVFREPPFDSFSCLRNSSNSLMNYSKKIRSIFELNFNSPQNFHDQKIFKTIFPHRKSSLVKLYDITNHFPHFEGLNHEGRRRGADSWQEIPGDRKPGRCLWGPRRRPLSVNGAESSPEQARGEGDGCQDRISMTKGRWDAFSSLLLPRRGGDCEGPPPLNSNAMGVCYANIPICC